MMWWYGSGISGWGMVLMAIGNLLFWAVILAGAVVLLRSLTTRSRAAEPRPTPEDLLAERCALGEIDEQEYDRRLARLTHRPRVEP